jgi:hypothetical protein
MVQGQPEQRKNETPPHPISHLKEQAKCGSSHCNSSYMGGTGSRITVEANLSKKHGTLPEK